MQVNTDIYVLHKEHLARLVERYPSIRGQILVIADYRYRMATVRNAAAATEAAMTFDPSAQTSSTTDFAVASETPSFRFWNSNLQKTF